MKHLIKYKDGSVAIMTTVSDETRPEDEIAKWTEEHRSSVDSHRPLDEAEMPEDRYFRDAWKHHDDSLGIDMDKCRDIHKDTLRELRLPKLEALDIEFIRASEAGDAFKQSEVAFRKQALRDVTVSPEILNAQTPEELKAFIPEILK